jgi:pimeloyl-ACP methyl ester carboxylesterase
VAANAGWIVAQLDSGGDVRGVEHDAVGGGLVCEQVAEDQPTGRDLPPVRRPRLARVVHRIAWRGKVEQQRLTHRTALAARGPFVVRFDNRDVGLSTHLHGARTPSLFALLRRDYANAAYRLEDLADDTAGLLDGLGLDSAHVVGASMGGMIAQTLAIRRPARVRSLTSIMSTTSPQVGRATCGHAPA